MHGDGHDEQDRDRRAAAIVNTNRYIQRTIGTCTTARDQQHLGGERHVASPAARRGGGEASG